MSQRSMKVNDAVRVKNILAGTRAAVKLAYETYIGGPDSSDGLAFGLMAVQLEERSSEVLNAAADAETRAGSPPKLTV